ncbi:MAG: DMT family transporter [Gammaproteobacteria bacterium]|nr:DMT family transporter [Gammaproteobacteria bacterium]MBL7000725.1 DMT family transporter [Gammaproteobacteria bacterium]
MNLTANSKGILLAFSGIVLLSPDSLLIRLIDTDLWSLMFLRGLFMGVSLLLLNFVLHRGQAVQQFKMLDRYAWGIIVLTAISSFFFVASIQTTSVAHTLIIVGSTPVVAAVLALYFLHEKVSQNTWITIFIVVTGLAVVVYDDQQSTLKGDVYALIACLLWSVNFLLARLTRMADMVASMCIGGFMMALLSLPLAQLDTVSITQLLLSLLLGLLVGVSLSLITLAPRYILAAEVAVFLPLESVFGSLLVWWLVGEYPGSVSLTAGLVIVLAIMLNSYLQISRSTK